MISEAGCSASDEMLRLDITRTIADSKTLNRRNGHQTNIAQHKSVLLKEMSMVGMLTVCTRNGEL